MYQPGGAKEDAFGEAMARHAEFPVPHENAEGWVHDCKTRWITGGARRLPARTCSAQANAPNGPLQTETINEAPYPIWNID